MSLTKLLKYVSLGVAVGYSCGVDNSEPSLTGCVTDHDCKGERVCNQGQCVAEGNGGSNGGSGSGGNWDFGDNVIDDNICDRYLEMCSVEWTDSPEELRECNEYTNRTNLTNNPKPKGISEAELLYCAVNLNKCVVSAGGDSHRHANAAYLANSEIYDCVMENGWFDPVSRGGCESDDFHSVEDAQRGCFDFTGVYRAEAFGGDHAGCFPAPGDELYMVTENCYTSIAGKDATGRLSVAGCFKTEENIIEMGGQRYRNCSDGVLGPIDCYVKFFKTSDSVPQLSELNCDNPQNFFD